MWFPGLEIDSLEHKVRLNGKGVTLTPKEFDLLWLMASNQAACLFAGAASRADMGI